MATYSIKHHFNCGISDDATSAAAGEVLPSHWNANLDLTISAPNFLLGRTSSGSGAAELISFTNFILSDGTSSLGTEIPFDAGLSALYVLSTLGYGIGTNPVNNAIEQTTLDTDLTFSIAGSTAFELNVDGSKSTYDLLFPVNKGTKYGSLTSPTARIYSDGTDLWADTRVSGTGAFCVTYNLKVSPAQDVYSVFGAAGTTAAISPSDSTDRFVSWKVVTSGTTAFRAGLFIGEFDGTSSFSGRVLGVNGAATAIASASGNMTANTSGGGLSNRYFFNYASTSATLTLGSAISVQAQGTTVTEGVGVNFESPSVTATYTWTQYAHARFRFSSTSTSITTGYGILLDTVPSTFATTAYQLAMDGTSTRSGAYFNISNGGTEFVRSDTANSLMMSGATKVKLAIGGTTVLTVASGTLTLADATNITGGTSTGTKIMDATNKKMAFWNKTPINQPTTSITGATRSAVAGTNITINDTFGGYTVAQLAAIIINTGLAA